MDCHVQMPKCVLKQFAIQEGSYKNKVFCWNIETGRIDDAFPKSINTKKDYYSKMTEEILSSKIETPLGNVIKNIKDSLATGKAFRINQKVADVIFNYLYALLARSPQMAKEVGDGLFFRGLFSEQNINDITAVNAISLMQKELTLKDFNLTFVVNNTGIPFVLPTCGYYDFKTDEEDGVIHIPLTEKVCVRLFQAKYQDKYIQNGKLLIYPVLNKNVVERVNELAFETQSRYANAYLVSSSKVELERIKGKIKNEK